MVSWPGHIPQNAVRNQVAVSIDWMPTIAEYCGIKPPDVEIDGMSIKSIIDSANAPTPHKDLPPAVKAAVGAGVKAAEREFLSGGKDV